MSVTSEGVADSADEAAAQQAGCDTLQGYHFGMPEDLQKLEAMATRRAVA